MAGELDGLLAFPRLEVAQLVEDVVRRQQHLVLLEELLPVLRDDGGVVQRLPAPARVRRDAAEDQGDVAGHLHERFLHLGGGLHEDAAVEEVARRIADHGELGDEDDVGAGADAVVVRAADHLRVGAQRADGGIDLADVNLHRNSHNDTAPI